MMRRIITTMAVALCLTAPTHAQSFLDHLQDGEKGKGPENGVTHRVHGDVLPWMRAARR